MRARVDREWFRAYTGCDKQAGLEGNGLMKKRALLMTLMEVFKQHDSPYVKNIFRAEPFSSLNSNNRCILALEQMYLSWHSRRLVFLSPAMSLFTWHSAATPAFTLLVGNKNPALLCTL
jgi:hypothetical protein